MAFSNQEAQRLRHNYIGSEHILLALIREGNGTGATVLKQLGVDLCQLRNEVERQILAPAKCAPTGVPASAKAVIAGAIAEAEGLGHHYVGTEHLVLGLIRDAEGLASRVLVSFGLDLPLLREAVGTILRDDRSRGVRSMDEWARNALWRRCAIARLSVGE